MGPTDSFVPFSDGQHQFLQRIVVFDQIPRQNYKLSTHSRRKKELLLISSVFFETKFLEFEFRWLLVFSSPFVQLLANICLCLFSTLDELCPTEKQKWEKESYHIHMFLRPCLNGSLSHRLSRRFQSVLWTVGSRCTRPRGARGFDIGGCVKEILLL